MLLCCTLQCPVKEPNISLLLYVCTECKAYIQEKQVVNQAWYDNLKDESSLGEINSMNMIFIALTNKITASLQKVRIKLLICFNLYVTNVTFSVECKASLAGIVQSNPCQHFSLLAHLSRSAQ